MGAKDAVDMNDAGEEYGMRGKVSMSKRKAKKHVQQLQSLQVKDPEFYQFLKDHDKELLEFNAEGCDDYETDKEELAGTLDIKRKPQGNVVTSAMVDSWIKSFQEKKTLSAVISLLRAFKTACHCGDDGGDKPFTKFSIISSSVFNKIMMFVLNEMDGILRELLGLPASGGKRETITDMMTQKKWNRHSHLVRSYIGNALHILNQMTDTEMIAFTLRRLRNSSIFLAAFPSLLRKYIKVILHFWGTGGGALPVASFLFLRDLCVRLGSDCTDVCFKGIYKAYILNCHFINAVTLQHVQFLRNCVTELFGVDLPTAYQHSFTFIRQLAMILREALSMKTKDSFRKVYEWKFMNSLELWTGVVCAHSSDDDIKLLCYPLTQIITGVASSAQKAQYFPLRFRCVSMLNRIAASTGTFIPVSKLLLDMLDMKELKMPPTGGVGKAVNLHATLKLSKPILKTRSFHEACVCSVIEELATHLAQWSCCIAFAELSFMIAVRARSFRKSTRVERFRQEMGELIHQIDANAQFVNEKCMSARLPPNDPAISSFLEEEKKSGASPLSQYAAALHQKAQQKSKLLLESSVTVGAQWSVFGDDEVADMEENTRTDEAVAVFSSSWLPKAKHPKDDDEKQQQQKKGEKVGVALYEDVVEDLVLSSDEDEDEDEWPGNIPVGVEDERASKKQRKKQKLPKGLTMEDERASKRRRKMGNLAMGSAKKNAEIDESWKKAKKAKRKR